MLSSNGSQIFFTGLFYIWGTQQQPTTIQNFTGLILGPHMGGNSTESNFHSDFYIFWINAKKGLFFSEQDSLYLQKRITSFSGHINVIPLHVCIGYDFWLVFLPLIWKNTWSFSTFKKNISCAGNNKSASQCQNLHFQKHSPDLIWI